MSGYTQYLYHPRSNNADQGKLDAALKKLRDLEDVETRAIVNPILADHTAIMTPILKQRDLIRAHAKHLIILGSGGSGLSGRALTATFTEATDYHIHALDCFDLYEAEHLMKQLDPEDTALLVISKSGTTVETLAYMDVFLQWLKSASHLQERITVITINNNNVLHEKAKQQGWHVLHHNEDLCGRFSIFSNVGLLPAAFVGMDIKAILAGAKVSWEHQEKAMKAAKFQYDALAYGLGVHVTFAYGKRFAGLIQWWRQGVAESLGKQGKGIYSVCAYGTCDQHSQLQLFLDGNPIAMFTLLTEESSGIGITLSGDNLLPMLNHKTVGDVIQSQQVATLGTLNNAGKSIRHLALTHHQPEVIGAILMQWTQEIILLGYMLGVNPFDQPAIEESKCLSREYLTT